MLRTGIETIICLSPNFLYVYVYVIMLDRDDQNNEPINQRIEETGQQVMRSTNCFDTSKLVKPGTEYR